MKAVLWMLLLAGALLVIDWAAWYDLKRQGRRMGSLPVLYRIGAWLRHTWRKP